MTPNDKVKAVRKSPKSRDYVKPQDLQEALLRYKAAYDKSMAEGLGRPKMDDDLGEMFMKISQNYSKHSWFRRYPFIQEVVGEGIVHCVKNAHRYNPDRGDAFAFITQILKNSFYQKIAKEKKNLMNKFSAIDEKIKELTGTEYLNHMNIYNSVYSDEKMREFMFKFETTRKEKNVKNRQKRQKGSPTDSGTKIEFD